ncbi:homoserine dehydrogenase, NAD binding domain protein, partial [Teladorsagia circumcincta]
MKVADKKNPYLFTHQMQAKRVGIIGYGHLGEFLVTELNRLEGFEVVRIWNRTPNSAKNVLPLEKIDDDQLRDIDLVVEVAHPAIIRQYAPVILANCDLFIGSPTCLADADLLGTIRLMAAAKYRRVLVPAGAFWGGNDIQKMADQGILKALTITMTKHPSSFKLESPLKELNETAIQRTEEATVLYE